MAELFVSRAEALRRFVRKAMQERCEPAGCGLLVADWIDALHGVDPAIHLRARCATPAGVELVIREAGGIEALLERTLEPLCFYRTATPTIGDVGIVRDDAAQLAMAIRGEGEWIGRAACGVICQDFETVAAWKV